MHIQVSQLRSQVHPERVLGKIVQFPVTRMLAALLFLAPFLVVHNTVIGDAIAATQGSIHSIIVDVDAAASVCIILLLYALYTRWIEARKAQEISMGGAVREAGTGVLLAGAIIGLAVLPLVLAGYYRADAVGHGGVLIHSLFFFTMGALIQELAFRLILFRLLEELTGTWLALGLVAIAFALAHSGNPGASTGTFLATGVGDVLLGACFVYTRRIWLVWGFHAGWNYLQDGVLGMPNSGVTQFAGWIDSSVSGPVWLTGGPFGIEASWIVLLATAVAAVWILRHAVMGGQILQPVWRRQEIASTP